MGNGAWGRQCGGRVPTAVSICRHGAWGRQCVAVRPALRPGFQECRLWRTRSRSVFEGEGRSRTLSAPAVMGHSPFVKYAIASFYSHCPLPIAQ
ncbi:hypothetical protein PI95_030795 [Hassallia byssoidea VB512170]|uniref:Uncharacterized protein n=1 Tax=Hassallia byssoidea VB512170 TaxID=1304833 RepID=A0A846HJL3_9CYAN|nr:hypothetical protein [Hassalia byssoidea]NEU76780.1 hypothetical protein [Hassalia byssoidea VB512170]